MNKEKLANFHRENIIGAAHTLFMKYGFEKTTVEMLAKESSYSKPTLYSYFRSKEEIYACNLYKHMRILSEAMDKALDGAGKMTDVYLNVCRAVSDFEKCYPVYFQGVIGMIDFRKIIKSEDAAVFAELSRLINEKICGLFIRGKRENILKEEIDVSFAYNYIWSCVVGLVGSERFKAKYVGDEKSYRHALDQSFLLVIKGFLKE